VAAAGLALGTLSCAFAVGLWSLVAARFLAGAFGGPATSIAMAIIADMIPPERRGRAMGAVAGAFSVASVIGVPAGLLLARQGGWRLPFIVVAGLGAAMVVFGASALPSMRKHIDPTRRLLPLRNLFSRSTVLLSYGMTAVVMFAGFLLIPNFPAYILNNIGYPRDGYPFLYGVAGVFSFVSLRFAGYAVDRQGSFRVGSIASFAVIALVFVWLVLGVRIPVMLVFIAFMTVNAFRNISYNTLTSKVPEQAERARFMSIQSTVQLGAMGLASVLSGFILSSAPGGKLLHMPELALFSMAMTAVVPVFLYTVERRVAPRPR
jgi:predicted MFS family arabinose efflux permease